MNPNVRVNQLILMGRLHERQELRVLPTGMPVFDCILWHESDVTEAHATRSLGFLLSARAVGPVAERMARLQTGTSIRAWGFVAPRRQAKAESAEQARVASSLIFTINEFTLGE